MKRKTLPFIQAGHAIDHAGAQRSLDFLLAAHPSNQLNASRGKPVNEI
jgi:hypothetical protein